MIAFEVDDMTCGHCVRSITEALKAVDNRVQFTVDPAKRLVMIESTDANPNNLRDAIAGAGYTPVRVEDRTANACAQATYCCGQQH
ncbi:heavy-metal-associated domain-containing protein [Paraburkholderia azotifigens]|uniref:heavy-metal-associated domain-containing protein n=1 Tax=Paraburkholderia azotifigens TaxID=2057004 RepID=UPI00317B9030